MERRNSLILGAICLFSAVFWGLSWLFSDYCSNPEVVQPLLKAEWYSDELRMELGTPAPKCDNLVFLGIDQLNYSDSAVFSAGELSESEPLRLMCQDFPWSRKVWAEAVNRLSDAGAKVIILDLLFFSPGKGDAELAAAVQAHADKVVLAANISDISLKNFKKTTIAWPSESIRPPDPQQRVQVGLANFWPDIDQKIRRAVYQADFAVSAQPMLSLTGQALALAGQKKLIPPANISHRFRFAGPAGELYKPHPIYEIFLPSYWHDNFNDGRYFRDKYVIIGPAGNWSQDFKQTPVGTMLGPELHLHALGAALTGSFLQESGLVANILLILLGGLGSFLILYHVGHPAGRLLLLLTGSAAYAGLAQLAYNQAGWIILCVPPLLAFNTGGALGLIYEYFLALLEKIRTRATFEKYVSQNVVKAILDQSKDFEKSLGGTRKPCTILFSDIRSFTTMTEQDDSQLLVAQLNEYLTEMVECVFRYEGTLDKFIGDAVMAVWGNVQSHGPEEDTRRATACALDMLEALETLNRKWVESGRPALSIGLGINHGDVIVGNMGSPRRKEFTVIGDAVNLASRLEGATKEYEIPLLIGENAAQLIRDKYTLQTVDFLRVKGKVQPVDTFTVASTSPPGPEQIRALTVHASAIKDYRAGHFAEALGRFEEALSLWPGNSLIKLYQARCRELMQNPPENWDGIYVLKTK